MGRLAVIPARGGSKRIPRKNIRQFGGQPLIAWPIRVALDSGVFDDVIVSTDDTEVAEVASEWGAAVPFRRPAELADDFAATMPVVAHAIREMARLGAKYSEVCCLYPAAVFVTTEDLEESAHRAASIPVGVTVAAVVPYPHPIQRALRTSEGGHLQPIDLSSMSRRSQDLERRWHDAGQFYWAKAETWLDGSTILDRVVAYELPWWRVQDIDTEDDWHRAELLRKMHDGGLFTEENRRR